MLCCVSCRCYMPPITPILLNASGFVLRSSRLLTATPAHCILMSDVYTYNQVVSVRTNALKERSSGESPREWCDYPTLYSHSYDIALPALKVPSLHRHAHIPVPGD